MPALPDVPNVLRTDFQWSFFASKQFITRLFWRYSGPAPSAADAVALAADVYGVMAGEDALWGAETELTGVKVTDLSSSTGGQGEHAQSTAGTRGSSGNAGATALLMNYVIGRRYRGGKPRSYLPWFIDPDLENPFSWKAASLTEADSAFTAVTAGVIGSESGTTTITAHVNVSYYAGFTVVTNPVTHRARNVPTLRPEPLVDTILSFGAAVAPASQRRRNRN